MVLEFTEFDKNMIHEKYRNTVTEIEKACYRTLEKWRCRICSYTYSPEIGDPSTGITPGTAFEKLPENWVCPVCHDDLKPNLKKCCRVIITHFGEKTSKMVELRGFNPRIEPSVGILRRLCAHLGLIDEDTLAEQKADKYILPNGPFFDEIELAEQKSDSSRKS